MKENQNILEAMLFASGEAVPLSMLSMAIGMSVNETRSLLEEMESIYKKEQRGYTLIRVSDAYQLSTNPIYYEHIRRLVQTPRRKLLTQALMETLSIIAYKQPVTKAQIEEIRGVNADHAVNKLMEYNLIVEKGRLDAPGKPILFGTSDDFLRQFGIEDLNMLPKGEEPEQGFEN